MSPIAAVIVLLTLIPAPSMAALPGTGPERAGEVVVEDALSRVNRGALLEGWRSLLEDVATGAPAADWSQPATVAGWETAALLLADLTSRTGTWAETLEALQGLRPWPAEMAPSVAFRLDHLVARCLRRLGEADRARGVMDRLGYFSDWYIAGPFDNERGSGFDVSYEPELRFDRQAAMVGKEREVRWRWSPARQHPLALVKLDELLRPNEQAVAYLATSLRPRDPGPVEIRVGSTGPYKLILNGEVVAEREVERPYAADQDRHMILLREGWNSLLVKLGHEEGKWVFAARLTDVAGRPMRTVQCESVYTAWPGPPPTEDEAALIFYGVEPEPGEVVAEPSPMDAVALPHPVPEARDVLEARPGDARSLRLLAIYHLLLQPEDDVDETLVEVARRAVEAAPDNVLALYLLARAYEPRGKSRNEMEVNKRLHALNATLEVDPEYVAALLDLAAFSLTENPIPTRADEYTQRAIDVAPGSWDVRLMRARFLQMQGRTAEADMQRREAEATEEASLSAYGQLARARRLVGHGLPKAGLTALREAARRDVLERRLIDELVDGLTDYGDLHEALRHAEAAMTAEPFDVRRMLETATRLEFGDGVDQARGRELVERALSVCPERVEAWKVLVRIDERAGALAEAEESLTEILRLDPSDSRVRRHLAMLTSGTQDRFEEPYRWNAADLVSLPLPDGEANDPLEVLARTVVWRVHRDGTEHEYQHVAMRVLNEGGARKLDVYPVVGQGRGRIYLYNARIIRPDGSIEYAPAPRRYSGSYRAYDLPPLSPGDVVDIEFRSDQSSPDVFGEYFGIRHDFYPDRVDGLAPTRHSELVVIVPEDLPLAVVEKNADDLQREISTDGGLVVRRWVAENLPRPPIESAMPVLSEFAPMVDITTFRDWSHFSEWWWSFIEKEFITTQSMRDKVVELTEGLETEHEKIEAIVRFVGQEIRYNAWAFGTHGYEPYSAPTIFERRFGDCKDKSILLRQLLAEIDVEAIPVLIKAESPRANESLEAAMVGHFNHCIAYVPATDTLDAMYLDATADRNPIEYLRQDDQGARVLHVGPDGGSLHDIPYALPHENSLLREYDIVLDENGHGQVRLVDTSNGGYGVRSRYRYGGETGDLAKNLSRELSFGFGPVDIGPVETSDLEDIGQPVRLDVQFEAPSLWSGSGEVKSLRVNFDPLGLDQVAKEAAANRTFEVVLKRPFAHDTLTTWKLPPGTRLMNLPVDIRVEAEGVLDYEQQVRETEQGIEVRRRFRLHTPRIPLVDYAAFRDAVQQVRLAEERQIRIVVPAGDLP
jgi:tetratricopeptide (TPR) repeat protein